MSKTWLITGVSSGFGYGESAVQNGSWLTSFIGYPFGMVSCR